MGIGRTITVYREPGRYAGWPANHGIWSWGDEILVGFGCGYMADPERDSLRFHAIDSTRPEAHLLARSLDGGESWEIEDPSERGDLIAAGLSLHGSQPEGLEERPWMDCPGDIKFDHADLALTARMTATGSGKSRFYFSADRGHNWAGPFELPLFGLPGVAARTDYVVQGRAECLLFLTGAKRNGREGRPFCAATVDGGLQWKFRSWIMGEPEGFGIMPATVRTEKGNLLTLIRRKQRRRHWLELYRSIDDGESWVWHGIPAEDTGKGGNPGSLTKLSDGRLAVTWGQRDEPWGMMARICEDLEGGSAWYESVPLGRPAGGHDLGYPQTVQRSDGKLVTVYYTHEEAQGERYIAATIWNPEEACR
jgi:hypothetical protein